MHVGCTSCSGAMPARPAGGEMSQGLLNKAADTSHNVGAVCLMWPEDDFKTFILM